MDDAEVLLYLIQNFCTQNGDLSNFLTKVNMNKASPFDGTKPYNLLPLLPPSVDVIIEKEVLLRWGIASRALAELNKNIVRLPNPNMLVNTISLQEAKASSEIENIFTTEDELYKAISDSVQEAAANLITECIK